MLIIKQLKILRLVRYFKNFNKRKSWLVVMLNLSFRILKSYLFLNLIAEIKKDLILLINYLITKVMENRIVTERKMDFVLNIQSKRKVDTVPIATSNKEFHQETKLPSLCWYIRDVWSVITFLNDYCRHHLFMINPFTVTIILWLKK